VLKQVHLSLECTCRSLPVPLCCIYNQHDFKGWGENQRIVLHGKIWLLTLTLFPVEKWFPRACVMSLVSTLDVTSLCVAVIGKLQVVHLKKYRDELVILDADWLGTDVIGHLLSHECISQLPLNGHLSADDLRLAVPQSSAVDVGGLLSMMDLCAPVYPEHKNDFILSCLDRSGEQQTTNECEARSPSQPIVNGLQQTQQDDDRVTVMYPRMGFGVLGPSKNELSPCHLKDPEPSWTGLLWTKTTLWWLSRRWTDCTTYPMCMRAPFSA